MGLVVTLQKTNTWLNHLMRGLPTDDRQAAYRALRATLHALRDRLPVEEVAQFGAEFPMLIRGFYCEGRDPTGKPLKLRHRQESLDSITSKLADDNRLDPEQVAGAVFIVLVQRVSDAEIKDVKHLLPVEIRDLWP